MRRGPVTHLFDSTTAHTRVMSDWIGFDQAFAWTIIVVVERPVTRGCSISFIRTSKHSPRLSFKPQMLAPSLCRLGPSSKCLILRLDRRCGISIYMPIQDFMISPTPS